MRKTFIYFSLFVLVAVLPAVRAMAQEPAQKKGLRSNYMAVLDLVTQDVDSRISLPLTESIRREIIKSGKYDVINRGDMNMLLGEQMYLLSGCASGECKGIVEAGRLLGVGKIVNGSVNLVGKTYYLSLSLIDVESGNTERIAEDKCKCEVDELIGASKRLAKRLLGEKVEETLPVMTKGEQAPSQPAEPEEVVPGPPKAQTFASAADMEFVPVKGGCFLMGDTFGDGFSDERPVHEVCVGDFSIGKYPVTQGQWKDIMGDNPSMFNKCGERCPAENISWNDTQEFIKKMKQRLGSLYRLPTEAEWEYAARSGGMQQRWAGTNTTTELGEYAWYEEDSGSRTHPVGMLLPNGFGLYDMSGNVWEWVQDWYDGSYYSHSPKNDPEGPAAGTNHVLRGGSFSNGAGYVRVTKRFPEIPDYRLYSYGFRLIRIK